MKLTQTGAGSAASPRRLYPGPSAKVFLQVDGDAVTTWKLEARATPDAPWVEVIAPGTADYGALIDWRPEVRLTVTAGAGTVVAYIGEAV